MEPVKLAIAFLTLAALLAAFITLLIWVWTQFGIDSCLDQGGRWNYAYDICEDAPKDNSSGQIVQPGAILTGAAAR